MKMYRFKQSQRFRVIVGPACFYATVRMIRSGVGDFGQCNAAAQKALDALEYTRTTDPLDATTTGIAGTWEGLAVQLDMA